MAFSPMNIPPQSPNLETHPVWYKRVWMWVLVGLVVLGALIIR